MGDVYNEAVTDILPPDDNMRIGFVTSVDPLTVNVQGAPVLPGHLSSYGAVVGDVVALVRQDQTWLCLGSTRSGIQPGNGTGVIQARAVNIQNIETGGAGELADYDTSIFDPFNLGMPGDIFTVPAGWDGIWDLAASCRFSANATGFRLLSININGVGLVESRVNANSTGGNPTSLNVSMPWPLAAGDQVSVVLFQNSGVTLTVGGPGADRTIFAALFRGSF